MNVQRYTEGQVLCGLREVWPEFAGDTGFDAESSIYPFLKRDGTWDDIDFDITDIFREIEHFFGFTCPDSQWIAFFRLEIAQRSFADWERIVSPDLTFGSLSRFIADRAPVIASFDPISVFGRFGTFRR